MSDSLRKRWENPEYKEHMRKKMSEAHKKQKNIN